MKQVGETVYGKNAREHAEKSLRWMRVYGARPKAPWYAWEVRAIDGGFAVFVDESE